VSLGARAVPVLALGWLACAGCSDDEGPRLDSATPSAAARNGLVAIAGHRLCGAQGDCARAGGELQLGIEPPTVRANIVSYSDTSAQIVIPTAAPVGATVLIAIVNERSSNALDFEVLP
jgi:hypothetical protein